MWSGVPDADTLKSKLAVARDRSLTAMERQDALSYLNGAVKVLARMDSRAALADYLRRQIISIKAKLYYGESA